MAGLCHLWHLTHAWPLFTLWKADKTVFPRWMFRYHIWLLLLGNCFVWDIHLSSRLLLHSFAEEQKSSCLKGLCSKRWSGRWVRRIKGEGGAPAHHPLVACNKNSFGNLLNILAHVHASRPNFPVQLMSQELRVFLWTLWSSCARGVIKSFPTEEKPHLLHKP